MGLHVQYGCGLSAPPDWVSFDSSLTLRIQRVPVIGPILRRRMTIVFPERVRYGDILRGLPVQPGSCDGVYASHVLEHLALEDLRTALKNTATIVRPGGLFRAVVPDLESLARSYLEEIAQGNPEASTNFVRETQLGRLRRPRKAVDFLRAAIGNVPHLWMWDAHSLTHEVLNAGFRSVRHCNFNDSEDRMFEHVEDEDRFRNSVALEATR